MNFRVELHGGPYDGAPDVICVDDPPPVRVYAFTCTGGRFCAGLHRACRGEGRAHTWLGDAIAERPPDSLLYHRQSLDRTPNDAGLGLVIYVRGEFEPVRRVQQEASIPAERETITAEVRPPFCPAAHDPLPRWRGSPLLPSALPAERWH